MLILCPDCLTNLINGMKMTLEYTVEVTEKCNYIFSVNAQTMEISEFKGVHCWVDDYQVSFTMNPGTGGGGGFAPTDNVTGPFGGGSGQNDDGDKGNQYIDADPCAMARNMNNNAQGFKDRVNTMHGEVSPHNTDFASTENGWVRTSDGRIYTPAEKRQSRLKYNWSTMEGSLTEWYHTHPMGAMLPNISDLRALAQQYRNGRITDVENFSYGVISSFGCASLVITSEDAFQKFAEKTKTEEGVKEIKDNYIDVEQYYSGGNNYSLLKAYVIFLQKISSGLTFLFRTYDYIEKKWEDWNVKEAQKDILLDNPCK